MSKPASAITPIATSRARDVSNLTPHRLVFEEKTLTVYFDIHSYFMKSEHLRAFRHALTFDKMVAGGASTVPARFPIVLYTGKRN